MKQVLIKLLWPDGLGGRVFEAGNPWTFQKWRVAAADLGITMDSWDMKQLYTAESIWLLHLINKKWVYEIVRKRLFIDK